MITDLSLVISYLCTLIGLGATAAYSVTFYTTTFNEIYYHGNSGYDDIDLPYIYALIECGASACTFVIGLLAFALVKIPTRGQSIVAIVFFSFFLIVSGVFGTIRAINLGYIGDEPTGTCSDPDITGCPTTRWEAKQGRNIMFTEPHGGQCSFWYWGDMGARYAGNACPGYADTALLKSVSPAVNFGTCLGAIETYMDWTKPSSYGWRDDPKALTEAMNDVSDITTIDKVHNMKMLQILQGAVRMADSNETISKEDAFTVQPAIAYCWYWGCSEKCQSDRYYINQWWFFSSLALSFIYLLNTIMSVTIFRNITDENFILPVAQAKPTVRLAQEFVMPVMGRTRRRMVQNPSSGLQF